MKQLITMLTLLFAMSLHAQWTYNGTGIQSPTNTASGNYSISMGLLTTASNYSSTSMGNNTTASGHISTAFGLYSTASGHMSTSMGAYTTAEDWGAFAMGQYNTADATPNPSAFNLANRAFVIGNGVDASNKSDAFKVLFDGTTTIAGSVTASSFIGDGSGLTNLPLNFNTTEVTGIESSDGTASGSYSTAMGIYAEASGDTSFAMGNYPTASGDSSTAMGNWTTASGSYSTAMGNDTTAIGDSSVAIGSGAYASGESSTAMGSVTTASGDFSTAIGNATSAEDYGTFSIGLYNTADATPNPTIFDLANKAFVIGNGVDASNKSDALTVLFDGTTTIAGSVTATSFIGDGSGLTNMPLTFNSLSPSCIESQTNTASGTYSIAMGQLTTASEDSSTAMGILTNASGTNSTAMGNRTEASGVSSTAMGRSTIASGTNSTAMGWLTVASGTNSAALGQSTTASDIASTAMGVSSVASGYASTAMGGGTEASGSASTSMGSGTEAIGINSTAMGSGTEASGSNSTAMGGVTIASGNYSTAMGVGTAASGGNSTTMGSGTEASGTNSTAMGESTIASGYSSTAMGHFTTAEDFGTFSMGHYNTADTTPNPNIINLANRAFVIGNGVLGANSDAMTVLYDGTTTIAGPVTASSFIGDGSGLTNVSGLLNFNTTSTTGIEAPTNEASGDYSTAMGNNTTASGNYATTMGKYTIASGTESTAMGVGTNASGDASTVMGVGTTAADLGTFAIGHFNTIDSTPDPNDFNLANRAFVIGNGEDESILSDAMIVLFDGTTTIAGDLTVNSDARLKSNIISLGSTLTKLLALDGKSYTFKSDESKQKIGLLAQDVQKVFPELVREATDTQGTLSVNYQGLIPVLINAIKEQDDKIREQDEKLERLEALMVKLLNENRTNQIIK